MIHIVNITLKDLKWPQMTSKYLKRPRNFDVVKPDSNKNNKLKRGSKHEVGEINKKFLDEDLHNNNL